MNAQIQPGQWVRWFNHDAPLGKWRLLIEIVHGWPRWSPTLVFADGYQVPVHIANLTIADEHGQQLWEVSETEPEEAAA